MSAGSFILEQENADLRGYVRELKKEIYALRKENEMLKQNNQQNK